MNPRRIVIVGGGAAGFWAAITCAERQTGAEILVLEKSARFLAKVAISGGGRCNVTHACFDARELSACYPRGGRALIAPFRQFQPRDTIAWFKQRGVQLKAEPDGRLFPVTDNSQTIIDCLINAARASGVQLRTRCGVEKLRKMPGGGFELVLDTGEKLLCDKLLLATGGCRAASAGQLAAALGHTLEPPVPSLFTFRVEAPWLRRLAGVSIEDAEVAAPAARLRERGALLLTHWGLSGPAILRLSAWGAREFHEVDYRFTLHIDWLPKWNDARLAAAFRQRREFHPARRVVNTPPPELPARLWEQLVLVAGLDRDTRWAGLSAATQHALVWRLLRSEFPVTGKSLNKDEFVTCGGVRLGEVNFKTMESRRCSGLHFAGELLDIDGITGGYNFQAAWTTGWLAGRAMAAD